MSLSLITITGTFLNPDGREPASGSLTATLSAPMTNNNQIVPPLKLVGTMNASGQLAKNDGFSAFQVFPTNAPGTIPSGLTYAFVLTVDGIVISNFSAAIPYDAPNGTIDLTALIPAAVAPVTASFIPAQIGQAANQAPVWNGTAWVPMTIDVGGAAAAEAVRAEAAETANTALITIEVGRAQAAEAFIGGHQVLGNTGTAKTLAVANLFSVASCVLTANCALTISGFGAGAFGVVAVQQDATGGRTLTVNGTSVTVPSSANAVGSFMFWSPDGTNLYVR